MESLIHGYLIWHFHILCQYCIYIIKLMKNESLFLLCFYATRFTALAALQA